MKIPNGIIQNALNREVWVKIYDTWHRAIISSYLLPGDKPHNAPQPGNNGKHKGNPVAWGAYVERNKHPAGCLYLNIMGEPFTLAGEASTSWFSYDLIQDFSLSIPKSEAKKYGVKPIELPCTCDAVGDSPCPKHWKENQEQDERIKRENEKRSADKYKVKLTISTQTSDHGLPPLGQVMAQLRKSHPERFGSFEKFKERMECFEVMGKVHEELYAERDKRIKLEKEAERLAKEQMERLDRENDGRPHFAQEVAKAKKQDQARLDKACEEIRAVAAEREGRTPGEPPNHTTLPGRHQTPVGFGGLNIDQAVAEACKQPTLVKALDWICVWECERAIDQAKNRPGTGAEGKGWDTCFELCIQRVMVGYAAKLIEQVTSLLVTK
jgi:hypothetical protein